MNSKQKVLVVGTTADYIEWIRQVCPERALFLTDFEIRENAAEPAPHPWEEILSDLNDESRVKNEILRHLQKWDISLDGITCFDCESLEMAASLAMDFNLPYPDIESINRCRDKYVSKRRWAENGVKCPRVRLVQSSDGVYDFLRELSGSCVVKPLTGSGSELVFRCTSKKDCDKWAHIIRKELSNRQSLRLYSNATTLFLAEEFIDGTEYSCDFIVRDRGVEIVRLTRKIHSRNKTFGTIAGYVLRGYPTEDFSGRMLEETLYNGAIALGVVNAICMVDFIVRENEIFLLEMTPRPGGDCIPHLLRRSGLLDMLTLALDFAQQRPFSIPGDLVNGQYVGLRLHAGKCGEIVNFDTGILQRDPRIREIKLIRRAGHKVALPPDDYESWYLGYIIFQPDTGTALENQCRDLSRQLIVEMT
ncbi:MAG: ATP-grasp domain-containing protein [Desulfobulbaceae bacterium]|nr:ATP-grasp domain-containing protein [Desulfobulbaceae bacterium]